MCASRLPGVLKPLERPCFRRLQVLAAEGLTKPETFSKLLRINDLWWAKSFVAGVFLLATEWVFQ